MRPVRQITEEEARAIMTETIAHNLRHPDYARTVERADFYYRILTGEGQDHMIVSYKPRETHEQKVQRIEITNSKTKSVSSRVRSTFKMVKRTDNITKFIGYPEAGREVELQQVQERVNDYTKGESVESYLNERFEYLTFFDPNAFMLTLFENTLDSNGSMMKPYSFPKEFSSKQAINYEYDNGMLVWLIGRHEKACVNMSKSGMNSSKMDVKEGFKYFLYTATFALIYEEIHPKQAVPAEAEVQTITTDDGTSHKYIVQFFQMQTTTSKHPAVNVGYIPDEFTNGRTYVSPLDAAENEFLELINQKSEYDLTRALHTFLQKIAYAPRCEFQDEQAGYCNEGYLSVNNSICPSCQGTGMNVHKTSQDVIYIALPESKDNFLPLSEFINYVDLPEWLPQWQDVQIDKISRSVSLAVFNSQIFDRSEVVSTATEKRIELENVYNVLSEYGAKYSEIYKHVVHMIAIYAENNEGLVVAHAFPKDFKLETLAELIDRRKQAIDAQSPNEVIMRIDNDIVRKQNLDNPDFLRMVQAKQNWMPFKDKTSQETLLIVNSLPETDDEVILWKFFASIFREIENNEEIPFYILPYQRQKELVEEQIAIIRERIKAEQVLATPSRDMLEAGETPTDLEAEAKAKLRGTVGGVQGIININKAVATGEMSEESAERLLVEIYGFTNEVAGILIQVPPTQTRIVEALATKGITEEEL